MSKLSIYIFFFVFLLSSTYALDSSYVYKINQPIDFKTSCLDQNYAFCDSTTNCTISVINPSGSTILNSSNMTYGGTYYNYTIQPQLVNETGEYNTIIQCTGGVNGFSTLIFEVTPYGLRQNMFLGLSIFAVIFFIALSVYLTKFFSDRESYTAYFFFILIFVFLAVCLNLMLKVVSQAILFSTILVLYNISLVILVLFTFLILIKFIMLAVEVRREKLTKQNNYKDMW